MEEMMQELEGLDADGEEDPGAEAPAPREPDRVMTMEEMMEAADVE